MCCVNIDKQCTSGQMGGAQCVLDVNNQYTSGQMGGVQCVLCGCYQPQVRWEVHGVCCVNVNNQYTLDQVGGVQCVVWMLTTSTLGIRWKVIDIRESSCQL